MAKHSIVGFEIRPVREKKGLLGRKEHTDQVLCIQAEGGNVYLSRSTLLEAGDNWMRLKRRLEQLSKEHDIPFVDYTVDE